MTTLEPFAAPSDLNVFLGRTVDEARATQALAAASAAIRGYCGWNIAPSTTVTSLLTSRSGRSAFLPSLYVTAVNSVTVDGTLIDVTDFDWSESGVLRSLSQSTWPAWSRNSRAVVVEYVSGYDEVPADVLQECLRIAAGDVGPMPAGVSSVRLGQLQVNYAAGTDEEPVSGGPEAVLSRYRIGGPR